METRDELLKRITISSQVMAGKPVIRGTRLTVEYILGLLAQGITMSEIQAEYKNVTSEDIAACLLFAKEALNDTTFIPFESRTSR